MSKSKIIIGTGLLLTVGSLVYAVATAEYLLGLAFFILGWALTMMPLWKGWYE